MVFSGIQKHFYTLLGTFMFWLIVIFAYDFFRRIGVEIIPEIATNNYLTRKENFFLTLVIGGFTGMAHFTFESLLYPSLLNYKSIVSRITVYIFFFILMFSAIIHLGYYFLHLLFENNIAYPFIGMFKSGAVWSFFIYCTICLGIYYFFKLINKKFGQGALKKIFRETYFKPRVEKKIFLFLDLKASTFLAEELGYRMYSALIQECFKDLNDVVINTKAEIYQYVGDEAVLIWDFDEGIENNECIKLFYSFETRIAQRKNYYKIKFGHVPEFKAGVHGGDLMVVEVGSFKRELAYHGDVINTAARIQHMCNALQSTLLISSDLLNKFFIKDEYEFVFKGSFLLKGKKTQTHLYSIHKNLPN